ncbi:hypothetical protein [Pseudoduganella lutea]|uniref:Uncharacterized protein n=1 Tax=Pseudoduganella lutea TaxID=321985 RepID=A0A4P6KTL2_9BURK|nr:hypothetical protein [Pseudoduganella lutea]QBE61742.1 hypothetical protein EWM63_00960 [Pseudoduganella lutea]
MRLTPNPELPTSATSVARLLLQALPRGGGFSTSARSALGITMANSIFVPALRMPTDILELSSVINFAFAELGFLTPSVRIDKQGRESLSLTDGFIMIEGQHDKDQCWVSIGRCDPKFTGDAECCILCDVKTRGSWLFAAVVAYAFCKAWGRTVFNDAGELDGQETYSAESLKEVILKANPTRRDA